MTGDITYRLNVNSVSQVYSASLPVIILYAILFKKSSIFHEKYKKLYILNNFILFSAQWHENMHKYTPLFRAAVSRFTKHIFNSIMKLLITERFKRFLKGGEDMDFDMIYNLVLTAGMGVITFFLKRSFDRLDSRASKSEVSELKAKIEHADEKYASKSELNELKKSIEKIESNIDFLKENTVRSSDFIRTMTRLEAKIDDLKRE